MTLRPTRTMHMFGYVDFTIMTLPRAVHVLLACFYFLRMHTPMLCALIK